MSLGHQNPSAQIKHHIRVVVFLLTIKDRVDYIMYQNHGKYGNNKWILKILLVYKEKLFNPPALISSYYTLILILFYAAPPPSFSYRPFMGCLYP